MHMVFFWFWSYSLFLVFKSSLRKKVYENFANEEFLLNPSFTTYFNDVIDNIVFFAKNNNLYFPDILSFVPILNISYLFVALIKYNKKRDSIHEYFTKIQMFTPMSLQEKELYEENPHITEIDDMLEERLRLLYKEEIEQEEKEDVEHWDNLISDEKAREELIQKAQEIEDAKEKPKVKIKKLKKY